MRAKGLWDTRGQYDNNYESRQRREVGSSITRVHSLGHHRMINKARPGREIIRMAWVEALHAELRDEFDRVRHLGIKFSRATLLALAKDILWKSEGFQFIVNMIDPMSDKPLLLKIDHAWIQYFRNRFRIESRAHSGKGSMSPKRNNKYKFQLLHTLEC